MKGSKVDEAKGPVILYLSIDDIVRLIGIGKIDPQAFREDTTALFYLAGDKDEILAGDYYFKAQEIYREDPAFREAIRQVLLEVINKAEKDGRTRWRDDRTHLRSQSELNDLLVSRGLPGITISRDGILNSVSAEELLKGHNGLIKMVG